MKEYHKIQTVFLRDPETKFKTLLEGQYAIDRVKRSLGAPDYNEAQASRLLCCKGGKHMTHPLSQNPAKTAEDANCFAFEVERDFTDFQVIVEIVNVEPPDKSVGIFGSTIEIEAYTLNGRNFSLTETEHERATDEAITYMERRAEKSENERMDR